MQTQWRMMTQGLRGWRQALLHASPRGGPHQHPSEFNVTLINARLPASLLPSCLLPYPMALVVLSGAMPLCALYLTLPNTAFTLLYCTDAPAVFRTVVLRPQVSSPGRQGVTRRQGSSSWGPGSAGQLAGNIQQEPEPGTTCSWAWGRRTANA